MSDSSFVDFEERAFEMCRKVIDSLIEKGALDSEADALDKLQNREFISRMGYEHIRDILQSELGMTACRAAFSKKPIGR